MGISKEMCLELMAGQWNEQKASPAWKLEREEGEGPSLLDKVENAYRYTPEPVGSRNPEVEFAAIAAVVSEKTEDEKEERKTGEKEEKPKTAKPDVWYELDMSDWMTPPSRSNAALFMTYAATVHGDIFWGRRHRQKHSRTDEKRLSMSWDCRGWE